MKYLKPSESEKYYHVVGSEKSTSYVHVPEQLNYEPYQEAAVLPPVQPVHYNRRILLGGGDARYKKFGQRRIYDNGLFTKHRRSPRQSYRPRKLYGYYLRHHKTIDKTPPTRRSKHDWNKFAKLDVPSFGYYVPYDNGNELKFKAKKFYGINI